MGASESEQVARKYYESFNSRDFATARSLLTDDAVLIVIGTGERFEGKDAVVASDEAWVTAFDDGNITIEHVNPSASGDTVVVEYTGRGTHTGPIQRGDGEIPATGRQGELGFCDVVTLRHGKVCEVRAYYDTLSLMTQLGLLPESAAAS